MLSKRVTIPAPLRAGITLTPVLLIALFTLVCTVALSVDARRWDQAWKDHFPDQPSLRAYLDDFQYQQDVLDYAEDLGLDPSISQQMIQEAKQRIDQLKPYVGVVFNDVLQSSTYNTHPDLANSLLPHVQSFLQQAQNRAENLNESEINRIRSIGSLQNIPLIDPWHSSLHDGMMILTYTMTVTAVWSFIMTLILGRPLLFWIFKYVVVDATGKIAGRMRLVTRWILGWGPVLGMVGFFYYRLDSVLDQDLGVSGPVLEGWFLKFFIALAVLMVVAFQQLCLRPWQGYHDAGSGTAIVPE